MAQHIGIVGCSAPGAALCYETICMEAEALADSRGGCVPAFAGFDPDTG
jgi:hypothetical protein